MGILSMHPNCSACGATNRVPEARFGDHPLCGRCGADLMAVQALTLTDDSFAAFDVRSIPTLILFRSGHEVARQSGAMPAADLMRWVQGELTTQR
jgi:uncharacterized paraquat-inducible protein A